MGIAARAGELMAALDVPLRHRAIKWRSVGARLETIKIPYYQGAVSPGLFSFMDCAMGSKKPTIAHCSEWISEHLNKSLTELGRAVSGIAARNNAKGAYRSGATVIQTFREAHEHFDKGVKTALGELKRAMRITDLDHGELRKVTEYLLQDFKEKAKAATKPSVLKQFAGPKPVDERLAEFDRKLDFALTHFDVGLLDPSEPEPPPSMSVTVGSMIGSAVQQGTASSIQQVSSSSINVEVVRAGIAQLEEALRASEIPSSVLAEFRAELETIKAQLGKAQPSISILREAGQSLRTITESVAANTLTAPVTAGAIAVMRALGLM